MLHQGTTADIPDLLDLMNEFYAESEFELDFAEADLAFRCLLEKPEFGAVWIVSDGPTVAGYVILSICFSMEYGGLVGAIDDLYVRPAVRRKGFGHQLVQSLLIDCHDRGLRGLSVEVAPDNHIAQELYEKIGLQRREDDRLYMTAKLNDASEAPIPI